MTYEEFKTILASKGNKLAKKAIEIIDACGPLEELQKVVEQGANDVYLERDPRKPRSAYLTHHVLDACFKTEIGIQKTEKFEGGESAVIGPVHQSDGREEHFRYLLHRRFNPGTTGYRGGLFRHILNSMFYRTCPDQARRFAKILVEEGQVDITEWAGNDYSWTSKRENLEVLRDLGVELSDHRVIDCALNCLGCDPGDSTYLERVAVIRALLTAGAVPEKHLRKAISWQQIRWQLMEHDLLDEMAALGVIEKEHPTEFNLWLQRTGREGVCHG